MKLANYGSGPDLKEGWYNFDSVVINSGIGDDRFRIWDITETPDEQYVEWFDGGLINHVLCTMNDYLAHKALINIHRTLKPGATLTIIDMDLNKVIASYQEGRYDDIPIEQGTPDSKLCSAISGYGTRKSLYTPLRMFEILADAGFRLIEMRKSSEHDLRPKESLIFEATK